MQPVPYQVERKVPYPVEGKLNIATITSYNHLMNHFFSSIITVKVPYEVERKVRIYQNNYVPI